jgi:hypothetical protein
MKKLELSIEVGIEPGEDKPSFFEYLSDAIGSGAEREHFKIEDAHDLKLYLYSVKDIAWDLPSAMMAICDHVDVDEWSMYRLTKEQADHLVEVHGWVGLDLQWFEGFDT